MTIFVPSFNKIEILGFMDIGKAFEVAFNRKKEKNWEKIYVVVDILGHLHNHVGLTENFDQSENEEFLVNDSP